MAFREHRGDVGWGRDALSLKAPKKTRFRWVDSCRLAAMTIRGGGDPNARMALRPTCRMGPPLRSSAADAHYCIMVQILRDQPNTSMWREAQRPIGELPSDCPKKLPMC